MWQSVTVTEPLSVPVACCGAAAQGAVLPQHQQAWHVDPIAKTTWGKTVRRQHTHKPVHTSTAAAWVKGSGGATTTPKQPCRLQCFGRQVVKHLPNTCAPAAAPGQNLRCVRLSIVQQLAGGWRVTLGTKPPLPAGASGNRRTILLLQCLSAPSQPSPDSTHNAVI